MVNKSLEDYSQVRAKDYRNYSNAVSAVEAGLEVAINQVLRQKHSLQPGELPRYEEIQTDHTIQRAISKEIKKAYSITDNPDHPFHDAINGAAMKKNYFTKGFLEDTLFPHKNEVLKKVKEENFIELLYGLRDESQKQLKQRMLAKVADDIVTSYNLRSLKTHLTTRYVDLGTELNAVTEKEKLTRAIALDFMRYLGSTQIGIEQIKEAIKDPEGRQRH